MLPRSNVRAVYRVYHIESDKVCEIRSTVTKTSEDIDSIAGKVKQLGGENESLKETIARLTEENYTLRYQIEDLHQYSRKNNVVIHGVPEAKDENTREVVTKIASALEVKLEDYDLCTSHRLIYIPRID